MKHLRKLFALLMIASFMLAACGAPAAQETKAPEAPASQATEAPAAPAAEKVELVYWSMWNEGENQAKAIQTAIDAFEAPTRISPSK